MAIIALAGLIGLVVVVTVVGGPAASGTFPGPFYFWPLFPLCFFLAIGLLFVVVRFGVWGFGYRRWHVEDPGYRARGILQERFARGEISAEQLREMRRELERAP